MKKEDDYISREVADMYLPEKVKNLGIFCLVCTPFAIAGAVLLSQAWIFFALCALFFLVTGICALLCYKNQMVLLCSEEELCYRTFLGHYYFLNYSDLQQVKKNMDSITLVFATKKVHVESCAILSQDLEQLIKNWSEAKTKNSL